MNSSKVFKAPRVSRHTYFVSREVWKRTAAAQTPGAEEREALAARLQEAKAAERRAAFEEGRKLGREEAEKAFRQELERVRGALQALESEFAAFVEKQAARTAEVALVVARKVLGAWSESRLETVRESLRKVLARRREPGDLLTIRLHPEDHALIAPDQTVTPSNLKFVPEPDVARGGCVLESKFGRIDARLETQLEEIARMLQSRAGEVTDAQAAEKILQGTEPVREEGRVTNIVGTVIEARGPAVTVGEQCDLLGSERQLLTRAEVIGFRKNRVLLMPLGERQGIGPGNVVVARGKHFTVQAGPQLLGRVVNGLGEPIDRLGPITGGEAVSIHAQPNNPMERKPITQPLYTGVRAIDGLLTCGKGMRMGIFAGSGVGKSVLLGMMARHTQADINVIALIGERGREVLEFVERDLGPEGLRRSVVVAVTSDESPVLRIHGALLAASVAEYFARQGRDVMFMMDSVTRFAMAQREIGLAAGEPPTTKGYTPSTFAALPKLLERSGIFGDRGSITGFFTVLVEGDDMDEPVADHVRSILDGHIVLSRALSAQNHFPAIDVLMSISRLARQITTPEQQEWMGRFRDTLATIAEAQDLVNIGAYAKGSNPKIDRALLIIDNLRSFLKQRIDEKVSPEDMWAQMKRFVGDEVFHQGG